MLDYIPSIPTFLLAAFLVYFQSLSDFAKVLDWGITGLCAILLFILYMRDVNDRKDRKAEMEWKISLVTVLTELKTIIKSQAHVSD